MTTRERRYWHVFQARLAQERVAVGVRNRGRQFGALHVVVTAPRQVRSLIAGTNESAHAQSVHQQDGVVPRELFVGRHAFAFAT